MTEYAERDTCDLGEHYIKHVSAMTGEGLHSKAAIAAELAYRDAEIERLRAERDSIKQQAEAWKQEARAQAGIVNECYQDVTGKKGEPGDWNGANPVRECIEHLRAKNAELKALQEDSTNQVLAMHNAELRAENERIKFALMLLKERHPLNDWLAGFVDTVLNAEKRRDDER